MRPVRCLGAVLAGGASRRMGVDKALIKIDGVPLVQHAAKALTEAGVDEVVVVGGDPERLRALELRYVPDRFPHQGPLGGIVTALDALDTYGGPATEGVITSPCDVISPSTQVARAVRATLRAFALTIDTPQHGRSVDVVVPVTQEPQWLHAVWRRRSRVALEAAFDRGVRAPRTAAADLTSVAVEVGLSGWSRDADSPADLPPGVKLARHRS